MAATALSNKDVGDCPIDGPMRTAELGRSMTGITERMLIRTYNATWLELQKHHVGIAQLLATVNALLLEGGQFSPCPLNSREPGRADQPGLAAEFGRDDAQPGKEVEPGVSGQLRA
jgi:hypothetical protein